MLSLILLLAAIIVVCCHAYKIVPSIHNNVLRTYSSRRASTNFRLHLFGNPEPPKTNSDKKEGGGLFGGMGNMIENVKKAQEIAKQAEVVQRDLGTVLLYSLLNMLYLIYYPFINCIFKAGVIIPFVHSIPQHVTYYNCYYYPSSEYNDQWF